MQKLHEFSISCSMLMKTNLLNLLFLLRVANLSAFQHFLSHLSTACISNITFINFAQVKYFQHEKLAALYHDILLANLEKKYA